MAATSEPRAVDKIRVRVTDGLEGRLSSTELSVVTLPLPWLFSMRKDPMLEIHVCSDEGQPVPGIRYEISHERAWPEYPYYGVLRDKSGNFEIPVKEGRCSLTLRAPGFAPQVVRDVLFDSDNPGPPLTIRLNRGATVRGRVVGPEGHPVVGARVMAPSDTRPPVNEFGSTHPMSHVKNLKTSTQYPHGWTDSEGQFLIQNVPCQRTGLVVCHPEHPLRGYSRTHLPREGAIEEAGVLEMEVGSTLIVAPGIEGSHLVFEEVTSPQGRVWFTPPNDRPLVIRGLRACTLQLGINEGTCDSPMFRNQFDVPSESTIEIR